MKLEALEEILNLSEDMSVVRAPDREITSPEQFEATLEEMGRRFDAARRAMGIVNKLQPGPTKKKHASRVLTQMNMFRNYINALTKQLESMTQ